MRRREFRQLVAEALDELPEQFRRLLANLVVVVEDAPSQELLEDLGVAPHDTLLGLYQGIPLPERGASYGNILPDQITIFQRPIEALYHTRGAIKNAVQETVRHEVGHYFGLDDEQLDALMEE